MIRRTLPLFAVLPVLALGDLAAHCGPRAATEWVHLVNSAHPEALGPRCRCRVSRRFSTPDAGYRPSPVYTIVSPVGACGHGVSPGAQVFGWVERTRMTASLSHSGALAFSSLP